MNLSRAERDEITEVVKQLLALVGEGTFTIKGKDFDKGSKVIHRAYGVLNILEDRDV